MYRRLSKLVGDCLATVKKEDKGKPEDGSLRK